MAHKLTASDKKLIKLLEKVPAAEEKKTEWLSALNASGMTSELAGDVQTVLAELEGSDRTRYLAELALIVKQWRLAEQASNFRRR
ncbi:MAG TPA: hypothetical protein PLI60_00560 [Anaerolineaceae bacterium]|nr:hypothetical protein [Anaerolineaceae bacterium]HQN04483.1 hypothetical protein [Anaerolineaceae bacterium]HQP07631.1 hypothetical protein [Anaerolineaceae bacterium]